MDAIGGYQLLGRISENRPVSVWKGRDRAGQRDVAVKQVELTTDNTITRLRAQARVLRGISHPAIVEVLDLVEDSDEAWLIEAWIEGLPLSAVLDAGGALSGPQAVRVIGDLLRGLAHMGELGIVHGNIAPDRVLLDSSGAALLTDFGSLARADPSGPDVQLSPEARGGSPITPRSDIYSLAALLAELMPDRPLDIDAVVQVALARDPAARYSGADEFRAELDAAAAQCFGAGWRDQADLAARVAAAPPAVIETRAPEPAGSSVSIVTVDPVATPDLQVRSSDRPARPNADAADVRKLMEARGRGVKSDRNAGRFVPLVAAIVVVAAIVILVLSRHGPKKAIDPGLAFKGTYAISTTLQSAGAGVDATTRAGDVLTERWQVTPSCVAHSPCHATVTPSCVAHSPCRAMVALASGAPFSLMLLNGNWIAAEVIQTAAGCVGSYTFVLAAGSGSAAEQKLVGTMSGVFASCDPGGSEFGSVVASRAHS